MVKKNVGKRGFAGLRRFGKRLARDQRGSAMLEYIIIAVIICAACVGIFTAISKAAQARGVTIVDLIMGDWEKAKKNEEENLKKIPEVINDQIKNIETVTDPNSTK
jgi:Flp pilus assembly pilin Flp